MRYTSCKGHTKTLHTNHCTVQKGILFINGREFNYSSLSLFYRCAHRSSSTHNWKLFSTNMDICLSNFFKYWETNSMPTFASKEEKLNLSFYSVIWTTDREASGRKFHIGIAIFFKKNIQDELLKTHWNQCNSINCHVLLLLNTVKIIQSGTKSLFIAV